MALAGGVRLRDNHAFEQRKATVSAILDDLAPISHDDGGKLDDVRRLEMELETPDPPLAVRARFRYLEWWCRDGRGWRLVKYQYDYVDVINRSRLAYHRHDLPGAPDMLHSHCKPAGRPSSASHFRAYEVDLLEAHEEFAAVYASGRAIDCAGLRPLVATWKGTEG